ncbi:MAG: hypothetical protein HYY66_06315 [Candidatus Tectomicrobia bacterium]|nr:hypothetical protein [Candidatus Tectomicrobia bacterium]
MATTSLPRVRRTRQRIEARSTVTGMERNTIWGILRTKYRRPSTKAAFFSRGVPMFSTKSAMRKMTMAPAWQSPATRRNWSRT